MRAHIAGSLVVHAASISAKLPRRKTRHSAMKFRKESNLGGKKRERRREREREREGNVAMPRFEKYIKAISGVGVCGALVTVPTLVITFSEVATRRK